METLIKNKNDIKDLLIKQDYIPTNEIIHTLYNAIFLKMPILIEGPAGVGKTEIAKVLKEALNFELLRVQCYEGIDFSKVLYDYHYAKQMLMINALQGKIKDETSGLNLNEAINQFSEETDFFDDRFLLRRPLLQSIEGSKRHVLLIDEVDKSDEEFEALLLEFLGEFSVSIPEYGTVTCPKGQEPIVILTSNGKRELSDALRRRCAYLYIDYPSLETEATIIAKKAEVDMEFAQKVAQVVSNIRGLAKIKQKPSIAESVKWAQTLLLHLGEAEWDVSQTDDMMLSLNVLLKNKNDLEVVKQNPHVLAV